MRIGKWASLRPVRLPVRGGTLVLLTDWPRRPDISPRNRMAQPLHLGFIMDGNRRWARARGLPAVEGHRAGNDVVKKLGKWCLTRGVKCITLFAVSTENWKRAQDEVGYLMDLLLMAVTRDLGLLMADGFRLQVIGRRADLS